MKLNKYHHQGKIKLIFLHIFKQTNNVFRQKLIGKLSMYQSIYNSFKFFLIFYQSVIVISCVHYSNSSRKTVKGKKKNDTSRNTLTLRRKRRKTSSNKGKRFLTLLLSIGFLINVKFMVGKICVIQIYIYFFIF